MSNDSMDVFRALFGGEPTPIETLRAQLADLTENAGKLGNTFKMEQKLKGEIYSREMHDAVANDFSATIDKYTVPTAGGCIRVPFGSTLLKVAIDPDNFHNLNAWFRSASVRKHYENYRFVAIKDSEKYDLKELTSATGDSLISYEETVFGTDGWGNPFTSHIHAGLDSYV